MAVEHKDKIRVQLYMPAELIQDIDNYANAMGISRSGAIVLWCSQQITANKVLSLTDELVSAMRRLGADKTNEENAEIMKQIESLLDLVHKSEK